MPANFVNGAELNSRYVIQKMVGIGGNATVWRASDKNLARDVALKRLLREHPFPSPDHDLKEILSEATKHSKLVHHNIVQVYDIIEVEGEPLIVMEYVDGKSLHDSLRELATRNEPFPLEKAVGLLRDVLEGVDHAHSHDVCHRDLTPMNILLTKSGIPKIADFGIARILKPQEAGSEVHANSQGGTGNRDYMSPEQLRQEPADFLSDLFMVGITGYLLLSGRHPFSHPSGLFTIEECIANPDYAPEVPKPSAVLSDVQQRQFREYADIVMRLLHRERARRFVSAREAVDEIDAVTPSRDCPHPDCGESNPEHFRFCGFCGANLNSSRQPPGSLSSLSADELCEEGFHLARENDWNVAISKYESALEIDPNHRKTIWNLGHAFNRIGKYARADEQLTIGIDLPKSNFDFRFGMLYERSVARARLKNYAGALEDVNVAVTDPQYKDSIKALYHRACVHRYLGDAASSEADARRVLSQQSDHAGAIRLLEQLKSSTRAVS